MDSWSVHVVCLPSLGCGMPYNQAGFLKRAAACPHKLTILQVPFDTPATSSSMVPCMWSQGSPL